MVVGSLPLGPQVAGSLPLGPQVVGSLPLGPQVVGSLPLGPQVVESLPLGSSWAKAQKGYMRPSCGPTIYKRTMGVWCYGDWTAVIRKGA